MELAVALVSVLGTGIVGILSFIIKNMNAEIKHIKQNCYSERAVRQLIDDKIGGIHEDLKEIKDSINKLFNLYIENRLRTPER